MCGIVYAKSLIGTPVNQTVLKRYKAQRSRGIDGFGFYLPQEDKLTHNTREGRILSLLRRSKATEILFHHRYPTSTANVRNACHPFSTKDYFENNYVLVHNGIVWNDDELYEQHKRFGIEYISDQDGRFNDSEALAYDVAMYLEGWQDKLMSEGSIAFIVTKKDKNGQPEAVYFGRNYGSPLKMKITDKSITISSEGIGEDVEPHRMHRYDYATGKITSEALQIPTGSTYTYNNSGNYFTGMGFGHSDHSDDEFHLLGLAKTADEVERVIKTYDFKATETERIRRVRDSYYKDNFDNPFDAVMAIEADLAILKSRSNVLDNIIQADIGSEADLEEYMVIPDQIHYLQEALALLEKEAQSSSESQFFHLPLPYQNPGVPRISRESIIH